MNVLLKKLNKSNKIMIGIYLVVNILFLIAYAIFAKSILSLEGIETFFRISLLALFGSWFLLCLIWHLVLIIQDSKIKFGYSTIISIVFIILLTFSSFAIDKTLNKIRNIVQQNTATYTSVLISMKDHEFTSSSKIGMINNTNDKEGYILANKIRNNENLNNEIKDYDDYSDMLIDLYQNKIDAIFISSNYPILFKSEEQFANIGEDTKIIFSLSEDMKTDESEIVSKKSLTEPFTMLLLGVDSDETNGLNPNAAFNGDTILLITFNPKTLNATMLSIPRDSYVPISCNANRYNKINSSSAYGTSCVINTIQNLTDVTIDYFVKINFKGVVDLINSVGGITVDVEVPSFRKNAGIDCGEDIVCEQNSSRQFGSEMIYINSGVQTLNGEQALAYMRNRHQYLEGDIARNKHQQQVIEILAKQIMKNFSITQFESVVDTITKNIATNMELKQILSFYQTIKNMLINTLNGEDLLTIQKTNLEMYNLPVYLPNAGMYTSALGYYPGSMEAIKNAMLENLEKKEIQLIKTIKYDYNEDKDYSMEIIGKGIKTGETLKLLKSFIGSTVAEAERYANANGITLIKEYTQNGNVATGLIANQDVHEGVLLSTVNTLTIYIKEANKTPDTPPTPDPSNPDDPTPSPDPEPNPIDPTDPDIFD